MSSRIVIVGGGIVGLATAYRLLQARPTAKVTVLEKEAGPGRHQSTHNSGVLHAGLYYKPGSLKARLAVTGIREMIAFCRQHGIAHEICGKLVVATTPAEEAQLNPLRDRAAANGLAGVRLLGRDEMPAIEPHVGGLAALHVPEEGIVDYAQVCARLVQEIETLGGAVKFQSRVTRIVPDGKARIVHLASGELTADYLINCAGLHSDRVAHMAGETSDVKIIPFRGEYYQLRPERQQLVRHLIYPVPDLHFPFLGVHFTRLIHGGVEAGPNAVLACAREGYRKTDVNLADLADALGYPACGDSSAVIAACAGRKSGARSASRSSAPRCSGSCPISASTTSAPVAPASGPRPCKAPANWSRISPSSSNRAPSMWSTPPLRPRPLPWPSAPRSWPAPVCDAENRPANWGRQPVAILITV